MKFFAPDGSASVLLPQHPEDRDAFTADVQPLDESGLECSPSGGDKPPGFTGSHLFAARRFDLTRVSLFCQLRLLLRIREGVSLNCFASRASLSASSTVCPSRFQRLPKLLKTPRPQKKRGPLFRLPDNRLRLGRPSRPHRPCRHSGPLYRQAPFPVFPSRIMLLRCRAYTCPVLQERPASRGRPGVGVVQTAGPLAHSAGCLRAGPGFVRNCRK